MTEGLIETYLSTLHSMWPTSPEPRLHRSRGSRRSSAARDAGFYVLPDTSSPRMLVPAGNPVAAARSLQRFSAALSMPDTVKRLGVSATLRSRSGFVFPDRIEVVDGAGSLRDWLGDVLGEPVDFSVALGTARANRKPVLQVFDAKGRSLAFAKVGATPLAEVHVAAEVAALTTLGRAGTPAGIVIPRLIHAARWEGQLVLVMSALETSWWQRPARQWELPLATMDALHAHFATDPVPLTDMPLWQALSEACDQLPGSTTRDRLSAGLADLATLAGGRDLVPGAWHGDWTPWNMARRRGLVQLWDWERFETGVPAGLDRCHYGVNAVCRRDGVSVRSALIGLRLAGVDLDTRSDAGHDRLVAATYLAAITCRYLVGAQSELGATIRSRSQAMLDTFEHVVRGAGR